MAFQLTNEENTPQGPIMPSHLSRYLSFSFSFKDIGGQVICRDNLPIHLTFSLKRHELALEWLRTHLEGANIAETVRHHSFVDLLGEFFKGQRQEFPPQPSSPFVERATDFQKSVWERIANIPYGETKTYGELADALGNPGAARAVGHACNSNPLAIIVPCHRVTSASGLGGFSGGSAVKKTLLELERSTVAQTQRTR